MFRTPENYVAAGSMNFSHSLLIEGEKDFGGSHRQLALRLKLIGFSTQATAP